LIAFFPFYFTGLSCIILYGLSKNWRKLAAFYETLEVPPGTRFTGASLVVSGVSFNHCITIIITDAGLYLSPIPFIRLFSRPLLIPWSAIKIVGERKLLWATQLVFSVQLPGSEPMKLGVVEAGIREAIAARFREPEPSPFGTLG
jgi:hypothetical protein